MSEENVEVIKRLIEAFETGEPMTAWSVAQDILDPAMTMDVTRLPFPALARVYTGLQEIGGFWLEWLDAWGSLGTFEDFQVVEAGNQVVAWPARQTMKGKGSGVEIDMPSYAWVATVRKGKIVQGTMYMSKAEALEAAGLSE